MDKLHHTAVAPVITPLQAAASRREPCLDAGGSGRDFYRLASEKPARGGAAPAASAGGSGNAGSTGGGDREGPAGEGSGRVLTPKNVQVR